MPLSLTSPRHHIVRDHRGAVLIEFAITMPILILLNILVYDISTYYRLAERSQHAAQFIHKLIVNDSDHRLSIDDLSRSEQYRALVTGPLDQATDAALVVVDAMPFYANNRWNFVVCWSWSSNPALQSAPSLGSRLLPNQYPVDPWVPSNGLAASSAIIIVETHQRFKSFMGVSYLPSQNRQTAIGPVRYLPTLPINILLSRFTGDAILNDSKIRDSNAANDLLCQR